MQLNWGVRRLHASFPVTIPPAAIAMPKMLCRCGEVLRWSEIPNPIEWLLIADTAYDAYREPVDPVELYRAMRHLLRCPACGRLWVFWDGFGGEPTEYVPGAAE